MTGSTVERFTLASGVTLVGTVHAGGPQPVLLLHGGGQTRHSFRTTGERLAKAGFTAIAVDQRGHGDSDRAPDQAYTFQDFGADAAQLGLLIAQKYGRPPVAIGASLGGASALLACGLASTPPFAGLVLVDVTPKMDPNGVSAVHGFMRQHAREGFATVEEAADVIAAYLPHRPRPRSLAGLAKNLRHGADGRYYWHWDPAFLEGPRPINTDRAGTERQLMATAKALAMPVLLVRGGSSELVSEELARGFLELVPHAELADIRGAHHMVAGDSNSAFSSAILAFLAARFGSAG